jgi:thiol-disulfide isomerase/thioredoxin
MIIAVLSGKAQNTPAYEDPNFGEWLSKHTIPAVIIKFINIPDNYKREINIEYTTVSLLGQESNSIVLDKPKTVSLHLQHPFPYQQIFVSIDSILYTCIYAVSSLAIEIDLKRVIESGKEVQFFGEGVTYTQKDGPLNTYMNRYLVYKRNSVDKIYEKIRAMPRFTETTKTASALQLQGFFDSLKAIQNSYVKQRSTTFEWLLENERMSDYYAEIINKSWGLPFDSSLLDQISKHQTYGITNNSYLLYRYLLMYIQSNPSARVKTTWKDINRDHVDENLKRLYDSLSVYSAVPASDSIISAKKLQWTKQLQSYFQAVSTDRSFNKTVGIIDSLFTGTRADLLKMHMNNSKDLLEQRQTLKKLIPLIQSQWSVNFLTTLYKKTADKTEQIDAIMKQSLKNSTSTSIYWKPILTTDFGATLYRVSKTDATVFLKKLKEDHSGKSVFIDIWATWCAPCISEMPYSKKLHEESKALPVVFVYLCTENNSDEEKWKRKIIELKQPGIHFFIDEKLDSDIMRLFSLNGYPSYILLNKNGTFKSGYQLRPSAIERTQALADLLQ